MIMMMMHMIIKRTTSSVITMSANGDDDEDVHDESDALLSPTHVTHSPSAHIHTQCPHTELT